MKFVELDIEKFNIFLNKINDENITKNMKKYLNEFSRNDILINDNLENKENENKENENKENENKENEKKENLKLPIDEYIEFEKNFSNVLLGLTNYFDELRECIINYSEVDELISFSIKYKHNKHAIKKLILFILKKIICCCF